MQKLFDGVVPRAPVLVTGSGTSGPILISNRDRSSAPIWYGPSEADAINFERIDAGQSVREMQGMKELWLVAKWSAPEAVVWGGVGSAIWQSTRKIGTTFKGGATIELPADGTPRQLSTTVIGCDSLWVAPDKRNHPDALIWMSTHIEGCFDPNGVIIEGVTPGLPPAPDKRFPFPEKEREIHLFNAALYAWREPGQNIGTVRVYFAKHASGT